MLRSPVKYPFTLISLGILIWVRFSTLEASPPPALESRWRGDVRLHGSSSWPEQRTVFLPQPNQMFYDGNANIRLQGQLFFKHWGILEAHYEVGISGGDTRQALQRIRNLLPAEYQNGIWFNDVPQDATRFLNLTARFSESDRAVFYHRLDRLFVTLRSDCGLIQAGRKALTWGNGFFFNPMDLFRPFSPTDMDREYKPSEDLIFTDLNIAAMNLQLAYVPRRQVETKQISVKYSTFATKLWVNVNTTEFNLMLAKHYADQKIGLGSLGYFGSAGWRWDLIWTVPEGEHFKKGYSSMVANLDYSWQWWGKNFYGLMEIYFNTLGHNDYVEALLDPEMQVRLNRGEMFTLGKIYCATHFRAEVHPLLNLFITTIVNLQDPSAVLQPRIKLDLTPFIQVFIGGNLFLGRENTEFGGYDLGLDSLKMKYPDDLFLWIHLYF